MRGITLMAGLLVLTVGVALVAAVKLGGTVLGGVLVVGLGLVAVWPTLFLFWALIQIVVFARASNRIAQRLVQEVDRCGRAGEKIVLALLRFPPMSPLEFPFFASHRGVLDDLRKRFRTYDLIERTGFSSYVVLLPGTDEIGVATVRERLTRLARRGMHWRVHAGVSVHPEDGLTPGILLDHADRHCA